MIFTGDTRDRFERYYWTQLALGNHEEGPHSMEAAYSHVDCWEAVAVNVNGLQPV